MVFARKLKNSNKCWNRYVSSSRLCGWRYPRQQPHCSVESNRMVNYYFFYQGKAPGDSNITKENY